MKQKKIVMATIFAALALSGGALSGCATTGQQAATAVVKVAKPVRDSAAVYAGQEGVSVTVIALQDGTYLAQLAGLDSPMAGKVVACKRLKQSPRLTVYETQIDGRSWWFLHQISYAGAGVLGYKLYAPSEQYGRDGLALQHDEARSKKVNVDKIVKLHRKQLADGSLAELARFKRDEEEAKQEKALARAVALANKKCGSAIKVSIDWKTIDDEAFQKLSISGYCEPPLSALRQLCRSAAVRAVVQKELKAITCAKSEERAFSIADGVIHWTMSKNGVNNDQFAKKRLMETPALGGGKNLAKRVFSEKSRVCYDGRSVYVGTYPDREPGQAGNPDARLFYGKVGDLRGVKRPKFMSGNYFYDPRFKSERRERFFRGYNMQNMSHVDIDEKSNKCTLYCGTRAIDLQLVDDQTKEKILAQAPFKVSGPKRVPYGLSRDRRGIYYFVDRGAAEDSRDFQLYKGPVGKMKRMMMVNVVSDSEGDVFSTKSGSFRFVIEQPHSFWIQRGHPKRKLINVPKEKNLSMIYNELGPYLGEQFGTPCDLL